MAWSKYFLESIPLPYGGQLRTIEDARNFLRQLPDPARSYPKWKEAITAVGMVGDEGPTEFARRCLMTALYPGSLGSPGHPASSGTSPPRTL